MKRRASSDMYIVAEMGDRLATMDMSREVGAAVPLFGEREVGEGRSRSNCNTKALKCNGLS